VQISNGVHYPCLSVFFRNISLDLLQIMSDPKVHQTEHSNIMNEEITELITKIPSIKRKSDNHLKDTGILFIYKLFVLSSGFHQ